MQVPTPCRLPPGEPCVSPTSSPAAVVADTIVRTVELGVRVVAIGFYVGNDQQTALSPPMDCRRINLAAT